MFQQLTARKAHHAMSTVLCNSFLAFSYNILSTLASCLDRNTRLSTTKKSLPIMRLKNRLPRLPDLQVQHPFHLGIEPDLQDQVLRYQGSKTYDADQWLRQFLDLQLRYLFDLGVMPHAKHAGSPSSELSSMAGADGPEESDASDTESELEAPSSRFLIATAP